KPEGGDLKNEIEDLKTETAAVRELLRKMEEQQKTLLEQLGPLRAFTIPPAVMNPASTPVQPASVSEAKTNSGRYKDGIVIWQTPDDVEGPFLLKFNNNAQVRYLNSL